MMLLPEVINLSHKEIKFVQENIELLKNTGFDIDVFGENSIKKPVYWKIPGKRLIVFWKSMRNCRKASLPAWMSKHSAMIHW